LIAKFDQKKYAAAGISAVLGTLLHTSLVLGGIYVFFGESYASVLGAAYDLLLGMIMTVVATNGIPEALIAALVAAALTVPMNKLAKRHG